MSSIFDININRKMEDLEIRGNPLRRRSIQSKKNTQDNEALVNLILLEFEKSIRYITTREVAVVGLLPTKDFCCYYQEMTICGAWSSATPHIFFCN